MVLELRSSGGETPSAFPSLVGEARIGVADRIDIGVRTESGDSLGLNAKALVFESRALDIALAGGFDLYYIPGILSDTTSSAARFHAGPIVGVNLSHAVSLTAWCALTRLDWTAEPNSELDGVGEWTPQGGVGADLRVTPHFAVHPGVSVVDWGAGADPKWGVVYGVGLSFGMLPSFDDVP